MLLSFSTTNFKSFKDVATVSLIADNKQKLGKDALLPTSNKHIFAQPIMNVVGNIGKTNLVNAIKTLQAFVTGGLESETSQHYSPYAFDNNTKPTEFVVKFAANGFIYDYELKYTKERVILERLTQYTNGDIKRTLFSRNVNKDGTYEWKFSKEVSGSKMQIANATKDDRLFVATAYVFNFAMVDDLNKWFYTILTPNNATYRNIINHTDALRTEYSLDFLRLFDPNLADIRAEVSEIFGARIDYAYTIDGKKQYINIETASSSLKKGIELLINIYNSHDSALLVLDDTDADVVKFIKERVKHRQLLVVSSKPISNSLRRDQVTKI